MELCQNMEEITQSKSEIFHEIEKGSKNYGIFFVK